MTLGLSSASAQQAELQEVRLLGASGAPAQSAVFEVVNGSDHEIGSITVSCQLLDEGGKIVGTKAVTLRHLGPGSAIGDAGFPANVHGMDVTCRIVHQTSRVGR